MVVAISAGMSFVLALGLHHLVDEAAAALAMAGPLSLGWVLPHVWGRRGAFGAALGGLLGILAVGSTTELQLALVAIFGVELSCGVISSRFRHFNNGLNFLADLVPFALSSLVAAAVRGLVVAACATLLHLPQPLLLGFAAAGLSLFFNLLFAAILLAPVGRWHLQWSFARLLELVFLLGAITALCFYLFRVAGPEGVRYTAASVVALVVLKTWLALRFHIRGIGLHRALWLGLLVAELLARGHADFLLPFERDPAYCGQYAAILTLLLFVEMLIATMASDRSIENAANAALTAELRARNAELEKLAAADAEQKAFLDSVLNQMPAGVMIVGPEGEVLWRNRRHRVLWNDSGGQGVRLRDLNRQALAATKEHSVPFESWPIVKAIRDGVVTENFEARILSPRGLPADVTISAAPVSDISGTIIGAVSVIYDTSERKAALRLLRDNEERLRFALSSARMIAYDWSIHTQAIQFSEPLSGWIGPEAEAMTSLNDVLRVVHPNDQPTLRNAIGKLFGDGRECECEFRIPTGAGMLWVQCRGRRMTDDDGRPTDRVAGIILDISERRRNEERLRLLESAVVHARDAVVILEPTPNSGLGRSVLYANEAFCRNSGYSLDELRGRSLHFLRGPESDGATLDRLRDTMDNGDPYMGELLNYRRDGTTFWVEINVVPVPDGSGHCTHWVMIQRDIGERKIAELLLQRNRAQLADAQRAAKLGSWEFLPGTGEWTWSAERYRIFGFAPDEFPPSLELYLNSIHADDRDRVLAEWNELLKTDEARNIEFRIEHPAGGIRYLSEQYRCDQGTGGRATRYWGTTQDETEKRFNQERQFQSQKMEIIGQMAGGIAHDFNNLLTGIIGNLHMVRGDAEHPDAKSVATALRAANRAADLTKKLLGFARKNQLVLQSVRLSEIVAEVVSFVGRTFDPRIRIGAEIDPDHGVLADATLLSQVLLNLCLNARDAMPQGGEIRIRSAPISNDTSEMICISIEDTGSGIPPELLARVFEPFFTTKPIGQGTGLGLAMVHGILTQHRGRVEVESELGRGTRFDLYLPRAKLRRAGTRKSPGRIRTENHPTPLPAAPARQTILLVDDEEMIRDLGRMVLEGAGYTVLEAADGEAAVDMFREHFESIDLVLLDLTMPKLSGHDAFRTLETIDPLVRVLFSSGYSAESLPETVNALGMLPKPYRPQTLLDAVKKALASPRGHKRDATEESGLFYSRMPTPAV